MVVAVQVEGHRQVRARVDTHLLANCEQPHRFAKVPGPGAGQRIQQERLAIQLPRVRLIAEGGYAALDELDAMVKLAGAASITIDLADLRGYQYESGAMFAAYVPGLPNAVARGGRYDHVGEAFGRARPATGFTMDLRELARLIPAAERTRAIRAPWGRDAALRQKIAELRGADEIVVQHLPGHDNDQDEFDCDRALVLDNGNWILKQVGKV